MNEPVPGKKPWGGSTFERRASGWGISFERHPEVPQGWALLACHTWAACVMMRASTADRLDEKDDAALWGAIARRGSQTTEPLLVHLPSFGGTGGVHSVATANALGPLARRAASRAKSFLPYEEEIDEHEPREAANERESLRSYFQNESTHYRWFLSERADRIRWIDELRANLISELLRTSVVFDETNPPTNLRVDRTRNMVRLTNDRGGRAGRVVTLVADTGEPMWERREDLEVGESPMILVLADEFERPTALRALADVGIEIAFDPTPGWLNVCVEPGARGWLVVRWRGRLSGLDLEADLAYFDVERRELSVFALELREPIERLMRRVGHPPTMVVVETHPDDPEGFYGMDLVGLLDGTGMGVPRRRKLRPQARELLPIEWAEQLEGTWCPGEAAGLPSRLFKPPPWEVRGQEQVKPCRLCDGVAVSIGQQGYCSDCCADARRGLFRDDGFDREWNRAVVWSLCTLAEIEFGGAPAARQLAELPAEGPNADLLMLCRMLTARGSNSSRGSDRKSHAWTDWLARAGLLVDGVRMGRGVTVTAKDGHLCRSLLERQIDDFFYENGIGHETEPYYPYDSELNVSGYRADWKLADGTFVEALGFPNNPVYMAKAQRKRELAERHQIHVVSILQSDVYNLESIFSKWIPPVGSRPAVVVLSPRPGITRTSTKESARVQRDGNPWNVKEREGRVERCRQAVELQASGATRDQIADRLQISLDAVKSLLRDGKFYSNPASDSCRLTIAERAAHARAAGSSRATFAAEQQLSHGKSVEAWRDAGVLFAEMGSAG